MSRPCLVTLHASLLLTLAAGEVCAQTDNPGRPPLIRWQRTLSDALALAKSKKLPLLVVANQDGETACESLARNRYRDEAFARLANRYVAVIGSADRHNAQDFDEDGRRIPCPRFGCVTCGEHIAIEPKLYAAYFKGQRVAPRHIGIGLDGKEKFDRYLDVGLHKIDESLRQNADQGGPVPALRAGGTSLASLAGSPSHADRAALEARYFAASSEDKLKILAAIEASGTHQPGVLRGGLLTQDDDVQLTTYKILARFATPADLDILLRALGTAASDAHYRLAMTGLRRAAGTNDICKRALTIRAALDAASKTVDPARWARMYEQHRGIIPASDVVPNEELEDLDARIEANTSESRKGDPKGRHSLAIATDTLRYALNRLQNAKDPTFLLQDARGAVEKAEKAGAPLAATSVVRARIHWLLNEVEQAGGYAAKALGKATDQDSPLYQAPTSQQSAAILEIYARSQMRIVQSPNLGAGYPAAALTEAHRSWQALATHPYCTQEQHKAYTDLLLYVGARRAAGIAVRRAVGALPTSNIIHEAFRQQVVWERGWSGLIPAYKSLARTESTDSTLQWYEGYAGLLVAEAFARAGKRQDADPVYQSATQCFTRCADNNPAYQQSAFHYAALAEGGRAKLALDDKDYPMAVERILAGVGFSAPAFGLADGLQNTMKRTVSRLRRRLAKDPALLTKLDTGLQAAGVAPRK